MNHPPGTGRPRPNPGIATQNGAQNGVPNSGRAPPPGNFHKPAAKSRPQSAVIPYSPEESKRIQTQLNRVLGPEYVSCRPGGGGQNVSYIEGWKALNLANEIFGFNGWSSELISVQVDYLDSHGSGRVSLGLSVVVRITIRDGTFHEDFGYGNIDNAKNKAIAFEKCKKEAFTDALKRCLRCFGNVLGNCLYDKGIVAKMQKVKLPALELEWDDFHRDPLIVKREVDRQKRVTEQNVAANTASFNAANNGSATRAPSAANMAAHTNSASSTNSSARFGAAKSDTNVLQTGQNTAMNQPNASVVDISAPSAGNVLTPSLVKEYDLDDFDDSFVFSDDMPGDGNEPQNQELDHELNQGLDLETQKEGNDKSETPEQLATANKESESAPGQVFFTSSKKALDVQKASYQNGIPVYDHKFIANSVKRTVDPSRSTKIRRADLPAAFTPSQINANQSAPTTGAVIGKRPLGMPPSQRPPSKRLHKSVEPTEKENEVNAV